LDSTRPELQKKLILFVGTTNEAGQVDRAFLRRIGGTVEVFGRLNRRAFAAVLEKHLDELPVASNNAAPDFAHPGRIVMADERRQMGYPGLVMLLNRGSDHGIRAGQGITLFRETLNGEGPAFTVGTATVVGVTPQLSMVRIDYARDAVHVGDLAAIHRITQ